MSDELMELPEGWAQATFGDICKVQGGYAFKSQDYQEHGVLLIRISNLVDEQVQLTSNSVFLPKHYWEKFLEFQLKEGDVLIAMSGATTGKMATYKLDSPALLNQRVGRFKIKDLTATTPSYVAKLVESITEQVLQQAYGGAQPNISPKEIEEFPVPLPPLNEQKRIVAAIESLRNRSQNARSALSAIPELCDKFRQSVLAAAFRGDLTADWREQNPDVEPASALLERIRLERQYRWMKETSKPAKYKEPALLDSESLPELPCNWTWANLDQLLFSLRNGLPKPPAEEKPGIPILRISAVRSREINLNDIRFYRLDKSENVDTYFLSKGDLLFTRYNGSRAFVGVCGMVQQLDGDLLYPDKLIRGQLVNQALCLPEYIELACNVGTSRKFIDSHIKTSAGQHGIAGGDIKLTPVPLPPAAEQQLIVNRIKQQFSSLQKLIFQMRSCESNFQILDRSILAEAFRGELVEQDPSDEPASALLERIRADREQQMQGKIKKPGKKKRTGD